MKLETQQSMPITLFDRDRIKQVIVNLISNAIKYCDTENGEIDISSYYIDGNLKVNVTDNGKGIKRENQLLIFEPFFQA